MHVDDHQRPRDLVLALAAANDLVADGTGFTGARAPDDVVLDYRPQRTVKESFSDAGEEIHAIDLAPWREEDTNAAGEALLHLLRGQAEYRRVGRGGQAGVPAKGNGL